jgi:predicted Zn-dependent protease
VKKIFKILGMFFILFSSTCSQVMADAMWAEPQNITTYIQPHAKKELIKQAFAVWTKATKNKIVFKYVQDPKKADIKVKFVRDIADVTGNNSTIGRTYYETVGPFMISAEIVISERSPNGALFRKDAIYRVMVHEIGHAIGWSGHAESKDSVMYYAKVNRNATITPSDVDYIYKLYGF